MAMVCAAFTKHQSRIKRHHFNLFLFDTLTQRRHKEGGTRLWSRQVILKLCEFYEMIYLKIANKDLNEK